MKKLLNRPKGPQNRAGSHLNCSLSRSLSRLLTAGFLFLSFILIGCGKSSDSKKELIRRDRSSQETKTLRQVQPEFPLVTNKKKKALNQQTIAQEIKTPSAKLPPFIANDVSTSDVSIAQLTQTPTALPQQTNSKTYSEPEPKLIEIESPLRQPPATITPATHTQFATSVKKSIRQIEKNWDRTKFQASNMFFNWISSAGKFSFKIGEGKIGLQAERDVIPNHDVIDSYTVIDRFKVPLSIPLYRNQIADGSLPITFFIGNTNGLEIVNIRQVLNSEGDPRSIQPTTDQQLDLMKSSAWLPKDVTAQLSEQSPNNNFEPNFIERTNKLSDHFLQLDNLNYARYSNALNLIAHPFRLPLTSDLFFKMDEQEISSWKGYGQLEMGLALHFSTDPTKPFQAISLKGSEKVFYRGNFQFTVMREKNDFALLKISYIPMETGHAGQIQYKIGKFKFLDLNLFDKSILELSTHAFAFSHDWEQSFGQGFEVGFRYDMKTKDGRFAFQKAVQAQTALSENLHFKFQNSPAPPVQLMFRGQKKFSRNSESTKASISFLIKQSTQMTFESSQSEVELPDGSLAEIIRHDSEIVKTNRDFFGGKSSVGYYISHQGTYDQNGHKILDLSTDDFVIKGHYRDQQTSLAQLGSYLKAVEELFQDDNIFPNHFDQKLKSKIVDPVALDRCMRRHPEPDECAKQTRVSRNPTFGATSIRFVLSLTEQQLRQFALVPEQSMWRYLELSFGKKPGAWSNKYYRRNLAQFKEFLFMKYNPVVQAAELIQVDGGGNLNHGNDGEILAATHAFHKSWMNLQQLAKTSTDKKQFFKEASEAFYQGKSWTFPLIKLVTLVLRNEQLKYQVSASSAGLPNFKTYGNQRVYGDNAMASNYDNLTDFDKPGSQGNFDTQIQISDFNVISLANSKVAIEFFVDTHPLFVYYKISDHIGFRTREMFVYNHPDYGPIKQGYNRIVLDTNKTDEYSFKGHLSRSLKTGDSHRLYLSLSGDGKSFTPVQNRPFQVKD